MPTVKISDPVHHDLTDLAARYGESQGEVVRRATELLKKEAFWEAVARIEPDPDYWAEVDAWDKATGKDFTAALERFGEQ
jgi:hypothetical protein